jgi:hypothetical protein
MLAFAEWFGGSLLKPRTIQRRPMRPNTALGGIPAEGTIGFFLVTTRGLAACRA